MEGTGGGGYQYSKEEACDKARHFDVEVYDIIASFFSKYIGDAQKNSLDTGAAASSSNDFTAPYTDASSPDRKPAPTAPAPAPASAGSSSAPSPSATSPSACSPSAHPPSDSKPCVDDLKWFVFCLLLKRLSIFHGNIVICFWLLPSLLSNH